MSYHPYKPRTYVLCVSPWELINILCNGTTDTEFIDEDRIDLIYNVFTDHLLLIIQWLADSHKKPLGPDYDPLEDYNPLRNLVEFYLCNYLEYIEHEKEDFLPMTRKMYDYCCSYIDINEYLDRIGFTKDDLDSKS